MKIKIAILDEDRVYLSRIQAVFGTKYSDKLEIYSFTDMNVALQTLESARIEVLLASEVFHFEGVQLPERCAFAYLVDSNGIDSVNDQRAICKFQRADQIYKQILSAYSEKASSITGFKISGDACQMVGFLSASGGVGSSTMAAAYALRLAQQQKKVLYLNLEKFGAADLFFQGEGIFGMSDVIIALKSKKTNLPMKLESCIRQDPRGVYFYSQSNVALDMMELTSDEIIQLLSELQLMGEYQHIVLDLDFGLEEDKLKVLRQIPNIVMVGDGSAESNYKTERAYQALTLKEQNNDVPLTTRFSFLYNRVNSKNGKTVNAPGLKILGGAPRFSGAETQQIVEQLSRMDILDQIR